jgi:hypothetical protein
MSSDLNNLAGYFDWRGSESAIFGSVRDRANKYNRFFRIGFSGRLCSFQDGQHGDRAAEELQSTAIGGDRLVLTGTGAQKVAKLIMTPAKPGSGSGTLEAPHRSVSTARSGFIRAFGAEDAFTIRHHAVVGIMPR